jgi:hypothetical protein
MAITRRPQSRQRVPVPAATPTGPTSRPTRVRPGVSVGSTEANRLAYLIANVTDARVRQGLTELVEGLEAVGRPIDRAGSATGRGVSSAASGATRAARGVSAIQPGGILRTRASVKPKVAAKPRPSSTWSEDRNPPPKRKPTSNQRTRRRVRSE